MSSPHPDPPRSPGAATSWIALRTDLPPHGTEHLMVAALRRAGARSVEREGERVIALFPDTGSSEALRSRVEAALKAALPTRSTGGPGPLLELERQSREPWEARWRDAHPPRPVGSRFLVTPHPPGGDPSTEAGGRILLRLVPGVGFGTGEHPSTQGCIRLLERAVPAGGHLADVGSGSGILSVAAALLGAHRVTAFEMDPRAAEDSRRTFAANGVADRIVLHSRRVTPGMDLPGAPFTGVMANLEFPLLGPLLPTLAGTLTPGGWLLAAGLLPPEGREVEAILQELGLRPGDREEMDGWWSGLFHREPPSPEREGTGGG